MTRLAEAPRVMVATPIYDGAQGRYVRSLVDLVQVAQAAGLPTRYEFNLYQASITRARNVLVARFLASDCTHLLFIDCDIEFAGRDVLSMLAAMQGLPECAVLGAPYPRRRVAWQHVRRAAELGFGDRDPNELARYTGDFVFELLNPEQRFALNEPVELDLLGTGLMLIRREAIEALVARHPELAYRPDARERDAYGLGEVVPTLFYPLIEPATQALLSDDYAFCRRIRDAGLRIWLAPWVRTSHSGPAVFEGLLADLAPLYSTAAVPSE